MKFIVYNSTTGEINRVGIITDENSLLAQAQSGETSIEDTIGIADNFTDYYWGGSSIILKPLLSTVATWSASSVIANGVNTITFGASLPPGTLIEVDAPFDSDNTIGVVDDGTLELALQSVGDYEVKINSFPYKVETYTIRGI